MKIAIVAPSPVPYTPGGAEAVWSGLFLELAGNSPHDVELIKIPVAERDLPEVMTGYRDFSRLDLSHFDMVISGKYPAWMVEHPRHVVYMLHPLRGLYDSYDHFGLPAVETSAEPGIRRLLAQAARLASPTQLPALFTLWDEALAELGPDHPALRFPGPLARTLVKAMDRVALRTDSVVRHLAISRTVARRAEYFPPDAVVQVLHPPSDLRGLHWQPGEFFFTSSRHDQPKRLDLLIAGMAHYEGTSRLLIGGRGPESDRLEELASDDPRIVFTGRLSQPDLVDHYARAIGVPFLPLDEDLGLITLEALGSGKPVLTTRDSGGPMEFVIPGTNGIVVAPSAAEVGSGLTRLELLAGDPAVATNAAATVEKITWKRVADELTAPRAVPPAITRRSGRPRLAITSTFPIWPPRGGGQLRAYHLYGALAEHFDVEIVCLAGPHIPPSVRRLAPGVIERVVPRSAEHQLAEHKLNEQVGFPVTDIMAGQLIRLTPDYLAALRGATEGVAAVVLADPYLLPAVREVGVTAPVIYDAYNCEYVLKSQMLPPTDIGMSLLELVRTIEGDACESSRLVITVSEEDRAHMQRLYSTADHKFRTVPNGVDLTAVPFTPLERRIENRSRWLAGVHSRGGSQDITRLSTFIGSWHVPNNRAGARIVAMAPALPHVGFLLIGRHTETLVRDEVPPNVFLLGMVSNTAKQSVLASVDVALAPLSSGSGTNLKVVEYLAAGAPIVSTPVGLRGLHMDTSLVRSATIDEYPAAIAEELARADDDPGEVSRRTVGGRLAVEHTYGWAALGRVLTDSLLQVLDLPEARDAPSADEFVGLWPGRRLPSRWRSGGEVLAGGLTGRLPYYGR